MWERKAQSSLYGGGKKREIYKDSGIYTFVGKRLFYQRLCLFLLLFSHCGQKATRCSQSNAVFGWPSNLTGHGALVSLSATSSATGALFPVVWKKEKRNNRSAFSTITVWEKFWLGFSKNWSPYTGGGTDIVQERGGSDLRWIAAVASKEAVKKTLQSFDLLNSKRAHSLCLGRYYEKRESSIGFNKRSFGWNRIKGNRFASVAS